MDSRPLGSGDATSGECIPRGNTFEPPSSLFHIGYVDRLLFIRRRDVLAVDDLLLEENEPETLAQAGLSASKFS